MTRTEMPRSSMTGSLLASTWSKAGATSSNCFGSATQLWMPNTLRSRARSGAAVRSEWTMPLPAVIQLSSPGEMGCDEPRLSR